MTTPAATPKICHQMKCSQNRHRLSNLCIVFLLAIISGSGFFVVSCRQARTPVSATPNIGYARSATDAASRVAVDSGVFDYTLGSSAFAASGLTTKPSTGSVSDFAEVAEVRARPLLLSPVEAELERYLQRYGYLRMQQNRFEPRDAALRKGLRRFQAQMGLLTSGQLDKDTLKILNLNRCGFLDRVDAIGAIATGPWTKRNFSYAFVSVSAQLPAEAAKGAIGAAFKTWENAGAGLKFTEGPIDAADILIEWRTMDDADHHLLSPNIAHSDLPPGFSLIATNSQLPLHFKEPGVIWATNPQPRTFDLESVALHEIGHCLGLLHGDDSHDVMYAAVIANTQKRVLSSNDIAALRLLYP